MTRAGRGSLAPLLSLLAVTAVWGSTFVVVKHATDRMPVTDFLTWRFGLATLAMVVLRPRTVVGLPRDGVRAGAVLGLALGSGYLLQTVGLRTTPASVSGFITGMFVVLTPLAAAALLRRPPGAAAWAGVGLATAGLALLSLRGLSVGTGELLTLGCAVAFTLHIVGLARWAGSFDAYALAVPQLAVTALLSAVIAVPGGLAVPPDAEVWGALALTSLAATALAYVVQTWAQAHLSPVRTALVMTMEPVFSLVFAVALAGEAVTARTLLGAALVLVAMLLSETGAREPATPLASAARLEV